MTTAKDERGRSTVIELVKLDGIRLVPCGRLDMDTSGALILTNDGNFVYQVTHPKHEIAKTYVAVIQGNMNEKEKQLMEQGVVIEDYKTSQAKAVILETRGKTSKVELTIHEGKNRQVRKMFEAIGKEVVLLHRSKIGRLDVKDLKIGSWRFLTNEEINSIM